MRRYVVAVALLAAAVIGGTLLRVHADPGFDSTLFSATNGDRANACHQPALGWSATMAAIAQSRAQYIADTGDTVNHLEMSYGAENTGQSYNVTDPTQAAVYINQAYMASPEHRTNICDPRWNVVGIGSVFVASWQGHSNVWIDAEEFTSSVGQAPPRPTPAPTSAAVPPSIDVPGTGGAQQ